jgi:hypothetical protein
MRLYPALNYGGLPEAQRRLGALDILLVWVFLVGLYTNYTIMVSAKVPFPSAPSGIAGLILLWRRRDLVTQRGLRCFLVVVVLPLISMFWATNIWYLPRRVNGLIQLTYSLTIGYALFLTLTQASRQQIAAIFLSFALVIVIGCLLEAYGGLRPISDAARRVLYTKGVYENDLRDVLYYNRVRPKFFASEPSSVTFCYTFFSFVWFVTSTWRWKLLAYAGLVGLGLLAMPGPTLLLMLLLVLPYLMFIGSRQGGRLNARRFMIVACGAFLLLGLFVVLAQSLFAQRLEAAFSGNDPSFFYRVQGPALAGIDVMTRYPFAGAGLTGEPFIEREVTNLYVRSPSYSAGWQIVSPATELLINYFWLHWIYFGVVWGVIMVVAITVWLRALDVPSPAFCWVVWSILGQSSGAYVGPTCWAVMFLAAAAAVLHERPDARPQLGLFPTADSLMPALQRLVAARSFTRRALNWDRRQK